MGNLSIPVMAVVIFVVVSSKTGFNEHFRYVLPAFHPRLLEVSRKEVLSASHVGLLLLRVSVLRSSKKQGLAADEM